MTQQRLWCHDDQRLPEGQSNLPSENVEIVGGSGAVGDDHVDVGELLDGELLLLGREVLGVVAGHLEEPLGLGAAVLGSHPLHTVGQQHHQPRLSHPLGLT